MYKVANVTQMSRGIKMQHMKQMYLNLKFPEITNPTKYIGVQSCELTVSG